MNFALQTAQPESVYRLFNEQKFNIPAYQRPYEWEIDKCEKLWEDIESYLNAPDEVGYFLGILVLVAKEEKLFDVVDGQQRIISLSLLLRALYERAGENIKVRQSLYELDDTGQAIVGTRVNSEVHGDDEQKILQRWISADTDIREADEKSKDHYERNLAFFRKKAGDIPVENIGAFIRNLFDNVYLLPAFCTEVGSALTVFETINNRGQNLTDADIFKAILYGLANKDQTEKDFIKRWNELGRCEQWESKDDFRTFLFRCYMHILRGKREVVVDDVDRGDVTKLVAMRSFFIDGRVYKQEFVQMYKLDSRHWTETLTALEQIKQAWIVWSTISGNEFRCWKFVLEAFKNDVWVYPVIAFLFATMPKQEQTETNSAEINAEINIGGQPPIEFVRECYVFMLSIIRILYSKGFDSSLEMSAIQDEMFRATAMAVKSRPYIPRIVLDKKFKSKLGGTISNPNFRKGYCALYEIMLQKQHIKNGTLTDVCFVFDKPSVEHILPQRWESDYYDKWDEQNAEAVLNTLGNLCLLEMTLNIKGSANFFAMKRSAYLVSKFYAPKAVVSYGAWDWKDYQKRHELVTDVLYQFLTHGCEE